MANCIGVLAENLDVTEDELFYWQCPNCGWEVDYGYLYEEEPYMGYAILYGSDMFLGSKDHATTNNSNDPFGAATWIEIWRCPECGTVWEFEECNF